MIARPSPALARVAAVALLLSVLPSALAAAAPSPDDDDVAVPPDGHLYWVGTLAELPGVAGTDTAAFDRADRGWWLPDVWQVTLDVPGEALLDIDSSRTTEARLGVRVPGDTAGPVTGTVTLRYERFARAPEQVVLAIELPLDALSPAAREPWLHLLAERMDDLAASGIPGTAWFRHRAGEARAALGQPAWQAGRRPDGDTSRPSGTAATFALFNGGRAVSENLQLDRLLPLTAHGAEETIPVQDVQGITVREYDWTALVAGRSPELDPLAAWIPADQHAVFLPSFDALVTLVDRFVGEQGVPVIEAARPRAETAEIVRRYERQLGLPLDEAARKLGSAFVRSVAVTGADPYLRTGADVALLFQPSKEVGGLHAALALHRMQAQLVEGVVEESGEIDGVAWHGLLTPDRSVCSYLAMLDDAVVVTNSLVQLQRLVDARRGRAEVLGGLDEYRFFRDRYPRGAGDETALLVLSDATIRRWCGPRWRIGSSRRTRAAAVLAELQARYVQPVVAGEAVLPPAPDLPPIGDVVLAPGGVRSPTWGSLAFATPVLELPLERVTEEEAALYQRWRDGYARNWSNVFDPIAVKLHVDGSALAADVTVRPLISGSDYRELIEMTAGGRLTAEMGDPHGDALFHIAFAFDRGAEAVTLSPMVGMARMMAPQVDPLGWIGGAYAVYADADPFWDELVASVEQEGEEGLQRFVETQFHRTPLALHVEVEKGLALTMFLTTVRALVEQSAPGMTVWETREHEGESYVRVGPSAKALGEFSGIMGEEGEDAWRQFALYYGASAQGLVVSLNEDVVRRAVVRHAARRAAAQGGGDGGAGEESPGGADRETGGTAGTGEETAGGASSTSASADRGGVAPGGNRSSAWLGESVAVRIDGATIVHAGELLETGPPQMAHLSWSNLPILNEWKRLFPDEDPVAVHQRLWHRRLLCPGGGQYVWNEDDRTMESTVYGHPGAPKDGPALPPAVLRLRRAEMGLTFEEDGLRARAVLVSGE